MKQRLRDACPLELGEDYEATFKRRLMQNGTYNGRQHRSMDEITANQLVARFIRGCIIAQKASDVDPDTYPALGFGQGTTHTNSSTLYDFLEHRIPMMQSGGMLEILAIQQGWCNPRSTTGGGCADPRSARRDDQVLRHDVLRHDASADDFLNTRRPSQRPSLCA